MDKKTTMDQARETLIHAPCSGLEAAISLLRDLEGKSNKALASGSSDSVEVMLEHIVMRMPEIISAMEAGHKALNQVEQLLQSLFTDGE